MAATFRLAATWAICLTSLTRKRKSFSLTQRRSTAETRAKVLAQHQVGDIEQGLPGSPVAHPGACVAAHVVILRKAGAQERQAKSGCGFGSVRIGQDELRIGRACRLFHIFKVADVFQSAARPRIERGRSGTRVAVMIMAGGTGGHIFPALAVAKEMREAGWRVVWLGNPDGMEARLVPQHGFEMVWVRFSALRGKGLARKLMLPLNLLRGFWQGLQAIRLVRPNVVLGMGGYITFPGGMMAALTGVPLVLHEQNSVAGLANKVLARVADRIVTGFPDVLKGGDWLGNPVRPEIAALPAPAERFAGRSGALRVLIIGGSLGAQALNEIVPLLLDWRSSVTFRSVCFCSWRSA